MVTIAHLRQAGVSTSIILQVVEFALAEQSASRRATRAGVVGSLPTPRPAPSPRQPVRIAPAPPASPTLSTAEVRVVAPAGSLIPPDWQPDMGGVMLADQRRLSSQELAIEVRRFVDYYTSTGTRRQDWQAAFRCWLNSPYFEAAKRKTTDEQRPHFKRWADAYAELDAYSKGSGRTSWAEATQPVFAPEWR